MAKRQQVAARAAAPVPTSVEELRERFKDYPAIDLIERQLTNPGDPGSLPILLRDEDPNACTNTDHQSRLKPGAAKCHLCKRPARKWYVRWVNTSSEGRWAQMKARGYIGVEVGELQDVQDVSDLAKGAGDKFVRRGDSGKEVLMKRPLELHNAIKAEERRRRTEAMTEDLAEAAGSELGDEAGQMVYDGGIKFESLREHKTTLGRELDE